MPALAEIDLGTLTPDQAAAVGALRAEIGVLEDRNAAQADRIRRLEHPGRGRTKTGWLWALARHATSEARGPAAPDPG